MTNHKLLAFIFSFCSYSYELLLISFAGELSNNNFLVINLTLGFFILGLGIGANEESKQSYIEEQIVHQLIKNEITLCIVALSSYLLIFGADILQSHAYGLLNLNNYSIWIRSGIEQYYLFITLSASLSSFLMGYYTGFELPLLIKHSNSSEKNTALMLAYNYLGSLISAVVLQYVLKSLIGNENSFFLIILINLFVSLTLIKSELHQKLKLFFLITITFSYFALNSSIQQLSLKNFYYKYTINNNYNKLPSVITKNTPYQKINIIERGGGKILFLNRQFQFSFKNEQLYHEALVHIPISIGNINPQNILLLGGGDGLALRELLKYSNSKITHIELDPEFLNFCKNDPEISFLNQGSLTNPAVSRTFGDAFVEVKKITKKFDLIILDFPYPFNYDLWKLYSLEFFNNLNKKLTDQGVLVLDAPVKNKKLQRLIKDGSSADLNSIFYTTVKSAGFDKVKFYSFNKEGFIYASKNKQPLLTTLNFKFLSKNTTDKLNILFKEEFNFTEDPALINSIYKPTLQNFYKDY